MRVIIHHFDQNAHAIVRFGKNIEILGIYDERKKLQGRNLILLSARKRDAIA